VFDLDDKTLAGLMTFSKKVAKGIETAVPCKRVGVAVLGLEVPHAHVHLIPLNTEADVDFKKEKLKLNKEEFIQIANDISEAIK
jgi:histidine triad (HIT) family protein